MSKASSNKISELKSLRKGTPSKPQSQDDGVSSNDIPPNSQNEEEEIPQNDEKNKTSSKHLAENNIQNDDKISEIKSINKDLLEKEKEKEEKQSEINNKEMEEKQSEINVKENEEIISQQKKSEIYDGMTEKEKNTLKKKTH